MPGRPLLDYPAAADYLGVPERYLRRLVYERRIQHVKLADGPRGHVRFDPDVLDAFIRTHTIPASAP